MSTLITKKRVALGVLAATLGASFTLGGGSGPVSADPTQLTALVGVGSDTTQDIMNALSGFNNGKSYVPVNSGAPAYKTFISFDASPSQTAGDNCITPKIDGPTFTRPNGSGGGRQALYQTQGGTGFIGKTFTKDNGQSLGLCIAAPGNTTNGAVDFARSSSVSSGTASPDMVFIPFARDAVTFASYRPGASAANQVTTLTRKNLIDAFAGATRVTISKPEGGGDLTIIPCGIQTSSGTHSFWRGTVVKSDATKEQNAVAQCTPLEVNRLQESKGDLLKIKGDALDATLNDFIVIVGYSAAAYIAQANTVSQPNGFSDITIGSISDDTEAGNGVAVNNIGSPIQGTAPNLSPNPAFYASAAVGRDVYNVFPKGSITNGSGVLLPNPTTALFADSDPIAPVLNGALNNTSKICQETARIQLFGFAIIANCGNYTTTIRQWDIGTGA